MFFVFFWDFLVFFLVFFKLTFGNYFFFDTFFFVFFFSFSTGIDTNPEWYDLDDKKPWKVETLQLMAAMGLPGGGRNALPVRLARHFHIIGVLAPPSTTILSIFTKILQWHCNRSSFDPAHPLVTALDPYVKATLDGAC